MNLERFKLIFWDAFHRPKLNSARMNEVFEALEPINDILAGPLFAVYENGHCQYIFDDQSSFIDIVTADDLMDMFQDLLKRYAEGLEAALPPVTPEEETDLKALDFQLDLKAELCEMAYQIHLQKN
jgi:hypothetical protein